MWNSLDQNGLPIQSVPLGYSFLNRQVLTTPGAGTYIPTVGTRAFIVEAYASGAAGGGAATSSSTCSLGAGGGAGSYSLKFVTGAIKASYAYSIGAAGTAASGTTGGNGADTTFDSPSICTAKGGVGGPTLAAGTSLTTIAGGAGGAASGGVGDVKMDGCDGHYGVRLSGSAGNSGDGGDAPMGSGSAKGVNATLTPGNPGKLYGGGGSGAFTATTAQSGGAGAQGLIVVTEYA